MIGGSLGVAASAAVFQAAARSNLTTLVANQQPPIHPTEDQFEQFLGVLTGGTGLQSLEALYPRVQEAVVVVFDAAVGAAMWPSMIISVIGAILAIWLLRGVTVPEEDEIS